MLLLLATLVWAETGDTAASEPPELCIEIAVPAECTSGETIVVEFIDCNDGDWTDDGVVFELSVDRDGGTFSGGAIGEDGVYRADLLCPYVPCGGEVQNLYGVVFDEEGHQAWAFGHVAVFCDPDAWTEVIEAECDEGGCGCSSGSSASPSAAWLGALGLGALLARRRAH